MSEAFWHINWLNKAYLYTQFFWYKTNRVKLITFGIKLLISFCVKIYQTIEISHTFLSLTQCYNQQNGIVFSEIPST